ncbi:MAG: trypsin-like peptidase domain-containing protein [Blautia sp.]|nr:trypsin-like peptidase domain-containing protein [Blautia sp.]
MDGNISFRHNVMAVQSPETFVNVRGGFSRGRKDVYFVRAVGESSDFQNKILNLDRKLDTAMIEKRLIYKRLSSLPGTMDGPTTEFYITAYTNWEKGAGISLKSKSGNPAFGSVLESATGSVVELFKGTRSSITDTIIRNFVVKLWYRTDVLLGDVISSWSENECIKIVADNIVKTQDYLFYYYVTLLGCDVMLLNNKADVQADAALKRLSSEIALGAFGRTEVPEHKVFAPAAPPQQNKNRQSGGEAEQSAGEQQRVKVVIPPRHNSSRSTAARDSSGSAPQQSSSGVRQGASSAQQGASSARQGASGIRQGTSSSRQASPAARPTVSVPRHSGRAENQNREKTFEELAQLASSIVMIAVHDIKGDMKATGSGIMIGREGFILTNAHVVKEGAFFSVRIEDDEKVYLTREIIKINGQLDLAVIRIERNLTPLPIYNGRTKLVRGQKVVAIGSPLGLFNSVSDGIISGFRRIKEVDMIQFTAPISHGSSGGAVLNMNGEVIGISTAGIDSGQNINLAVDYESIRMFAMGFY